MALHSRRDLLVVHTWGVALSILLFVLHASIIFGIAIGLKALAETAGHTAHVKLVAPLLILGAFIVLFLTHLLEGSLWALFLWRKRLLGSFGEAVYFSLTSFSAVGYGDVVLRPPWRAIGAIMAVNGLLLFGCSTAFLFVVMEKVWKIIE
ncbi:potassium channel family protein [soil metagenome]